MAKPNAGVAVGGPQTRLEALDVLRGLAAAAVMFHHHTQYYDVLYPGREPLGYHFGPGHFGVELFFIISGFVILMTIERKTGLYEFVTSRIARLLPTFWMAAAISTTILYLRPMPPYLDAPSIPMILANMTMAPSLVGYTGIDMPYWTLTYEIVFYAAMAVICALGLLRRLEWACLVWLLFDVTILLTGTQLPYRVNIVALISYGNFFIAGMCLYRICSRRATALTYALLATSIAITLLGGGEKAFNAPGYVYLPVTAGAALLVWIAARYQPRWMNVWPLIFLGRISYPLYLVHGAIGFEIINGVNAAGGSTLTGVVLAMLASLALATALHVAVEVPGKRVLRTWFSAQHSRFRRVTPAVAPGD
jgi:peptidoglycan/LPS O-acetylase OafA/YrhL